MPARRARNSPTKTPWDKPRRKGAASQDIRDTREWLIKTYGGNWGKLKLAAERTERLEDKVAKLEGKIRDLKRARSY